MCYKRTSLCWMWIFSACLLSNDDVIWHVLLGFTDSTDLFYHFLRAIQQSKHVLASVGAPKLKCIHRSPCPASSSTWTDMQEQLCQWVHSMSSRQMKVCFYNQVVGGCSLVLCTQPQLLSSKLITFQFHKWFLSKPLVYRCIERCDTTGQSLLQLC